jgi:hypothetical protein
VPTEDGLYLFFNMVVSIFIGYNLDKTKTLFVMVAF